MSSHTSGENGQRATSVTESEIASQPAMWRQALGSVDQARALLGAPGDRVLAIGCGTSAFVAMAYAVLRERAGLGETDAAYGSEVPAGRHYDRVVAITRSGTTTEILDALALVTAGQTRVAVTAVTGQAVDALCDERLLLDFADEASVVQTRFPTTLLVLVRAMVGEDVSAAIDDCEAAVTRDLPVDPTAFDQFVFLGSGWTVGLAHEAALKVREAAQAWSESYPAMDYRHGPIAVATARTLVWIFGTAPAGLADAVGATGATVVSDGLDPLAQLVLAQRLALALAAARGLDPDRPRNLTRSVVLDQSTS
jgi:glutamine---fructose-6-phosphate transaminase (isomerizing)